MKNIVCHGLGETPKQWESVLRQIPTKVECPELFNFVQEKVFTYQKLYKAFERYCDSESELLNLCGLSLGGVLALNYASCHSEKVRSLVLIGTPYKIPRLAFAFQDVLFHLMPQKTFLSMGLTKSNAIHLMRSMLGLDIPHMASLVMCKTLIICGEKDKTNIQSADSMHHVIKQSQFKMIKGAGHQVNVEKTIELSKLIETFWK
ncbi:MAG: alpha/beta hydrolase [Bacillota bacterium]|nr:alpha/beta hydrolase [Bacillota bacterium]